jgi:hypothetical protein
MLPYYMKEAYKEREDRSRSKKTIVLNNIIGISLGDFVLTPGAIELDEQKWRGYSHSIGIGKKNLQKSDIDLLRVACFEHLPFIITGDRTLPKPTMLRMEMVRFPYSINGDRSYQELGIRLMPEEGRIISIASSERPFSGVTMETTPDGIDAEMGGVHVQILFSRKEGLPAITPPQNFKKEWFVETCALSVENKAGQNQPMQTKDKNFGSFIKGVRKFLNQEPTIIHFGKVDKSKFK